VPVQRWNVPWHVDVGQRVPLGDGRDQVPERFALSVKATLLDAYVSKVFPKGSVLGATASAGSSGSPGVTSVRG
ncbi:MAG: hypothetical protein ACK6CU_23690, partial [Deltaproteobacteria bacterium]